jgi:hypothetical protein
VEDVVAVAVRLADGSSRYLLTWVCVQDYVDPDPVCETMLRYASSCSLGSAPESARLCARYAKPPTPLTRRTLYECFPALASRPVPRGADCAAWRLEKAGEMAAGREIWYCGRHA